MGFKNAVPLIPHSGSTAFFVHEAISTRVAHAPCFMCGVARNEAVLGLRGQAVCDPLAKQVVLLLKISCFDGQNNLS